MIKNKTILYEQLRKVLLEGIENGTYKEGDLIPSERELEELYGVSRTTIRKAIDQLVNANYLIRVHGKGTFVTYNKISRNLQMIDGFTDSMVAAGRQPGAKLICSKQVLADKSIAESLNISMNSQVQMIKRVRLLDGEPIGIQLAYLPLNGRIEIDENDLLSENFSLYAYQKSKYGIIPHVAFESIEAVLSTKEQSQILSIPPNYPLLYVERIVHSQFNLPFEFTKSYFRSDRYKYHVRIEN